MSAFVDSYSKGTGFGSPSVSSTPPAQADGSASTRELSTAAIEAFSRSLIVVVPHLRAYALSMVGNSDRADDLVQDTLLKAWAARRSYQEGDNLRGWLFVILRNTLFSQYRKNRREVEDPDGTLAATLTMPESQNDYMDLEDFKRALAKLPSEQREALVLIGGSGFSYVDAAEICGCAIGTVKSRVNRARSLLTEILGLDSVRSRLRPIGD